MTALPALQYLPRHLPAPGPRDHKYTRGVVTMATGSHAYPGAALIGVEAAARTGIGMVRVSAPAEVGTLVLMRVPEAVLAPGRSQVIVAGSGWDIEDPFNHGRTWPATGPAAEQCAHDRIDALLDEADDWSTTETPFLVLDAGVLSLLGTSGLADRVDWRAVLTPHAGEAAELLAVLRHDPSISRDVVEADPASHAQQLSDLTGATVALKGHTTLIAQPGAAELRAVTAPTCRLATAGTGDALAGLIGGLLALNHTRISEAAEQEMFAEVVASAVELHGHAAARAARADANEGAPILASDIARALPAIIAENTPAATGEATAGKSGTGEATAGESVTGEPATGQYGTDESGNDEGLCHDRH